MKYGKILSAVLIMTVLAGCSMSDTETTEHSITVIVEAADIHETVETQAEETTTEPVFETEETGPNILPNGVVVKTDWSEYTPYKATEEKYTRLKESMVTDFIAGKDYEAVFPFAGIENGTPESYFYGFANAKGQIVCDPVYDNVATVIAGYYIVVSHTDDDRQIYGVISGDGSYYSGLVYDGTTNIKDEVVFWKTGSEELKVTAYDLNGDRRDEVVAFDPEKITGEVSLGYLFDKDKALLYEDMTTPYLVDSITGEVIREFDKWDYLMTAGELLILYQKDGISILDSSGEPLSGGKYTAVQAVINDYIQAIDDDGNCYILSPEGNILKKISGTGSLRCEQDVNFITYNDRIDVVDKDMNTLYSINDSKASILSPRDGKSDPVAVDGSVITNLRTGKTRDIGIDYQFGECHGERLYLSTKNQFFQGWCIIDTASLEILIEGIGNSCFLQDLLTGEPRLLVTNGGVDSKATSVTMIDVSDGREMYTFKFPEASDTPSKFIATAGGKTIMQVCGITFVLDSEGQVVFAHRMLVFDD